MDSIPSSQEILDRLGGGGAGVPAAGASDGASGGASGGGASNGASPAAAAPAPASAPMAPSPAVEALPPPPPPIRVELEASLRDVADVDRAVQTGRIPFLKKLIVAACRPFLRRQAAFNQRTIAALRELGGPMHDACSRASRLERWLKGSEQRTSDLLAQGAERAERLEKWLAAEAAKREQLEAWIAKEAEGRRQLEQALEQANAWANLGRVHGIAQGLGELGSAVGGHAQRLDEAAAARERLAKALEEARAAAQAALAAERDDIQKDRSAVWQRVQSLEEAHRAFSKASDEHSRRVDQLREADRESREADRSAAWERLQALEEAVRSSQSSAREAVSRVEDAAKLDREAAQSDRSAAWERLKNLEESLRGAQLVARETIDRVEEAAKSDRAAAWERLKNLEESLRALREEEKRALWDRLASLEASLRKAQDEAAELQGANAEALGKLRSSLAAMEAGLADARSVTDEQVAATRAALLRLDASSAEPPKALPAPSPEALPSGEAPARFGEEDYAYFQFELKHRGSARDIQDRQRRYVRLIESRLGAESVAGLDILDLGCASGVFVELLKRDGANARGVDSNGASVAAGQGLGRPVLREDLFAALEGAEPASLDAVTAFQVVEHLPFAALRRLARASARALRPGGVVVLETINPASLSALRWYFMDATHEHFLFPEVLDHVLDCEGFEDRRVEHLSQPAAWDRLEEPEPGAAFPDPAARAFAEAAARNFSRLNAWLYGPMEFCLSAKRPGARPALETSAAKPGEEPLEGAAGTS